MALPDDSNFNTKETEKKTKQVQRPGFRGQQDVESEDKNCTIYDLSIRKI